jgi:hypothetical protein
MLRDNYPDQVQFEWFLSNGANAIAHGENPLFTAKLNAPYGVNLMANTQTETVKRCGLDESRLQLLVDPDRARLLSGVGPGGRARPASTMDSSLPTGSAPADWRRP